jgi:hypothetical protein
MAKKVVKKTTIKVVKKTPKTYEGKPLKLGGGGRFEKLKDEIVSSGKSPKNASAIAASVGRKKYGVKKMATWSSQGKK